MCYRNRFSQRLQSQGFSLLEVVFASAIMAILLAMTSVSMRPAIEQEGPRGLAFSLAADLRAARTEAIRSGRMVGVCFASDNRANSLSRSAHLRVGEQKGKIWRTLSYQSEYDATIFIGKWGNAVRQTFDLPVGWTTSTASELCLFFGPDGRAFSPDIPALDGRYPFVVATAMAGSFSGAEGSLSAVRNPQTIWVSQSGTVEVNLGKLPFGELPVGGSTELTVAALRPDATPSGSAPKIVDSSFLPAKIEGLTTAGIGQNFVQIHPNQKDGQQLEYGLATIEVRAEDIDGGPLTYLLEAEASSGDAGKFSVSQQQGEMSFVYDEATRRHLWKTVVSWRPPPSAAADLTYHLSLTVRDPEGHTDVASTEAGLLPAVTSLPPARIVVCSEDRRMFLTNLDGANEVLITRDGQEYAPFFSQDGSCVFSFHDLDGAGNRELRSRPANGSVSFARLANFQGSTSNVVFDPTYTFAALLNPTDDYKFDWGAVTSSGGSDGGSSSGGDDEDDDDSEPTYSFSTGLEEVPVSNVMILNLMSTDPPLRVTKKGTGEFFWAANARHTFFFIEEMPLPKIIEQGFGPFSPFPGHQPEGFTKYLVGFPTTIVPSDVPAESAAGRVYNPANRDWYLLVVGNSLVLRNEATGASADVYSSGGGYETSPSGRPNPSWSANGENVAFIASPGSGARVVSRHVLDSNLQLRSSFETKFELSAPNATRVQLSPDGGWIYFLRDRQVVRAVNATGRPLVDITHHLDAPIADYVISP